MQKVGEEIGVRICGEKAKDALGLASPKQGENRKKLNTLDRTECEPHLR